MIFQPVLTYYIYKKLLILRNPYVSLHCNCIYTCSNSLVYFKFYIQYHTFFVEKSQTLIPPISPTQPGYNDTLLRNELFREYLTSRMVGRCFSRVDASSLSYFNITQCECRNTQRDALSWQMTYNSILKMQCCMPIVKAERFRVMLKYLTRNRQASREHRSLLQYWSC